MAQADYLPHQTVEGEQPLPPVAQLDVERYLGTWNQLAAIPQIFTLQCARNVQAQYGLIDATAISVINTCQTWLRRTSRIEGFALVLDTETNAQLRVEFPSVPFSAGEEVNYVVTYIDEDYTWALVGDPERSSGFVLARDKHFSREQWQEVRQIVEARGYNSWRFWTTPTTGGKPVSLPLSIF
ncbi:MAG: lipocalin [Halomonadaceae bacterium]|nr:MAG: lipocalin [Halomonadaceae bacterium]